MTEQSTIWVGTKEYTVLYETYPGSPGLAENGVPMIPAEPPSVEIMKIMDGVTDVTGDIPEYAYRCIWRHLEDDL